MSIKYTQDKAASAEILRLILQKMAGHPAAFNPPTYAVWYEFLAGINPQLTEAMNKLLGDKGLLTTEMAQHFFDLYISEGNPQAQAAFRQNMQKLLDNLATFAESTGSETDRFSAGLQKYGETLNKGVDAPSLKNLVGEIMQDTQSMRSSVESLQGKLYESKEEVEKLQHELQNARNEALSDPMTGVFNRRGFDAQMKKLVANPDLKDKRVCFMMLDIDFFKKVNDTYGHLFGDKVIRGVAAALTARVKGQDSVARMGGEEFAVILPDTPMQGAYALAEQIRQNIANSKIRRSEKQDVVEGITISIGIADCEIGGDWADALSRADEALYVSKTQGRNRTTLYAVAK
ncbi:MAG: GGDEF domain-containing protein [Proteobacteria bacterium]|nr:GGDEF domain-containing protein [Pseudomonadota bacterium]